MRRLHEREVRRIGEELRRAITTLDLPDAVEGRVLATVEASLAASSKALAAEEGVALAGLSAREHEVARLKLKGQSNAEIAVRLGITATTVRKHLLRIYHKTNSDGGQDLARTVLDSALHQSMERIRERLTAARRALADATKASRLLQTAGRHVEEAERLASSASEDTARFFAAGGRAAEVPSKDEERPEARGEEPETQSWGRL